MTANERTRHTGGHPARRDADFHLGACASGLTVRCCALLAVLGLATGCGPLTLTPSAYSTIEASDSWRESTPYRCIETGGLARFVPGPREAAAGIHLDNDEGSGPTPCPTWHGILAQANFRFGEVELRDNLRGRSFSSARLKLRLSSTGRAIGGPDIEGDACLLRLGVATERWPDGVTRLPSGAPGSRPGFRLISSEAFLLREPLPSDFARPVDVTAEVRAWLDGTSRNHGFVLIPFATPDSDEPMNVSRLRRLSASCSAIISGVKLEVRGR